MNNSNFDVNVISNYERTLFGVKVFESNRRGQYRIHEGIEIKYSKEDAQQMAQEIESRLLAVK